MYSQRVVVRTAVVPLVALVTAMAEGAAVRLRRQQFSTVDNTGEQTEPPEDKTKLSLGLGVAIGFFLVIFGTLLTVWAVWRAEVNLQVNRDMLEVARQEHELNRQSLMVAQEDLELKRQDLTIKKIGHGMGSPEGQIVGSPTSHHFRGEEHPPLVARHPGSTAGDGAPEDMSVLNIESSGLSKIRSRGSTKAEP